MRVNSMRSAGSSVIARTRGDRHREVLRVGERLEEPALLVDQREDRQEGDRDHEQREEDRRPDLLQRLQADRVEVALAAAGDPLLEPLVGVLDLDDRAVDQHADRDRDAGERHDVRREPHEVQRDEGEEDRDRDGDDRDDRRRDVPEEEQDDDADDDHLLARARAASVSIERVDQLRAVVGRDDLDARRAASAPARRGVAFTRSMTLSAFSPWRMTTMPPTVSPRPSRSATPRRMSGPSVDRARRCARGPACRSSASTPTTMLLEVVDRLHVAAAAHHVLGAGELEQPAADLVVALADGVDDAA